MADWMAVPLLQHEGGDTPQAYRARTYFDLALRRLQDPRWRRRPDLDPERPRMAHPCRARDGRSRRSPPTRTFATNVERVKRRAETDGRVAAAFASMDVEPLVEKLARYDIAFGRINDLSCWAATRICGARRSTVRPVRSICRRQPQFTTAPRGNTVRCPRSGSTPTWCAGNSLRNSGQSIAAVSVFVSGVRRTVPMISTSGMTPSVRIISSLKSLR